MTRYNEVLAEVLSRIDQKYIIGGVNNGKLWLKLGPEIPKSNSASTGSDQQGAGGK